MLKHCHLFLLSILCICCNQNSKSSSTKKYEVFDSYEIEVPSNLTKSGDAHWKDLSEDEYYEFGIMNTGKNDRDLKSILKTLRNKVKEAKKANFKTGGNIEVNELNGKYVVYEEDVNEGVIPVMSYYFFGVIEDGPDVLEFMAISFKHDCTSEILNSMKSVSKINDNHEVENETRVRDNPNSSHGKDLDNFEEKIEAEQIFRSEGFAVDCECELFENEKFLDMYKDQGGENAFALTCAKDENDYDSASIYNINIYDESADYDQFAKKLHSVLREGKLETYIRQLKANRVEFSEVLFHGLPAVEYLFMQQELPTKAIYFIRKKKSYLLQVGSHEELNLKFDQFINSFKFISHE